MRFSLCLAPSLAVPLREPCISYKFALQFGEHEAVGEGHGSSDISPATCLKLAWARAKSARIWGS